ncbi:MAG: hypothetical protein WD138_01235, partial [Halofilum sp. (in: g-proteobacteria)]
MSEASEEATQAVREHRDELRPGERIRAALQSRAAMVVAIAIVLMLLFILAWVQGVGIERIASLTAWGIMLGGIIALGAIGLTLIYGVVKFPNFSHGAMVTLGAYIAFAVVSAMPGQSAGLGPFSFGWDLVLGLLVAMPL